MGLRASVYDFFSAEINGDDNDDRSSLGRSEAWSFVSWLSMPLVVFCWHLTLLAL